MTIEKTFLPPKANGQPITPEEINTMDEKDARAADKTAGETDHIEADWTISGDQTHLNNAVSISGSIPGAAEFNLYNADMSVDTSNMNFNFAHLTLDNSSSLKVQGGSSMFTDGYHDMTLTGTSRFSMSSTSSITLPKTLINCQPHNRELYYRPATHAFEPDGSSPTNTLKGWKPIFMGGMQDTTALGGSFYFQLTDLVKYPGALLNGVQVNYTLVSHPSGNPTNRMHFQVHTQDRFTTSTNFTNIGYVGSPWYGTTGSQVGESIPCSNHVIDPTKNYWISISAESGTNAVIGNVIESFIVYLYQVKQIQL